MDIVSKVLLIMLVAVPAIVLHEVAHGFVAWLQGDGTARRLGRLSLNPIFHIDPFGTVLLPSLLYLVHALGWTSSLIMFGWAKPVPVEPRYFAHPRRGMLLVALAGPATNLILAGVSVGLLHSGLFTGLAAEVLFYGTIFNVGLAVFNMIPLPPLDGSRVLAGLLPERAARWVDALEPFGIFLVLIAANIGLLNFTHPLIIGILRLMGM